MVELKKNSVQISCFPTTPGLFIPHKDVSLPPLANVHLPAHAPGSKKTSHLGYVRYNWVKDSNLVEQLLADRSAVVASKHFVWNEKPQPYDAFHMVMYQLWLRRHTIRYAEREWA